ncbi:MAG: glycosyl transferase family protein [Thermoleophilia bacterium]|nr:glycosyl transferase family protein [Thermoleophilia bacterium]MCZ4496688.1 glycosyl transferase family protein [Thermoleophilia bacterium]
MPTDPQTPGHDTWVIVPCFNEANWIRGVVDALAAQVGIELTVLVIDNASTDGTGDIALEAAAAHPGLDLRVLVETEKGTGCASDSGARCAIAAGATRILRTDGDCLPAPTWAARMADSLHPDGGGLDLVGGNLRARRDDGTAPFAAAITVPVLYGLIRVVARYRPDNNQKDQGYQAPFLLAGGLNMGITASAYEASGGFPRTRIEDVHEDKELVNRVRRVSSKLGYRRDAIVHYSNRRAKQHGIIGTLRWYLNHGAGADVVDVR